MPQCFAPPNLRRAAALQSDKVDPGLPAGCSARGALRVFTWALIIIINLKQQPEHIAIQSAAALAVTVAGASSAAKCYARLEDAPMARGRGPPWHHAKGQCAQQSRLGGSSRALPFSRVNAEVGMYGWWDNPGLFNIGPWDGSEMGPLAVPVHRLGVT